MNASMHFDTLTYANKLKAAGMEPKLAEAQALALVDALDDGVATKSDLHLVKNELNLVKNELKTDLTQLSAELRTEISQLEAKLPQLKAELIQWMVGLFITNITFAGAFIVFAQFLGRAR